MGVLNLFAWLFDAGPFLTRNHCGEWPRWLMTLYMLSNALIALSYFAIPACLLALWKRRRNDVAKPWILILFGIFITLCGLTHAFDVVVFWWAPYRLFTAVLALTGLASAATACLLPGVVLALLRLPSRSYVHAMNERLNAELLLKTDAYEELAEQKAALEEQVGALEEMRRTGVWAAGQERVLSELKELLRRPVTGEGAGHD